MNAKDRSTWHTRAVAGLMWVCFIVVAIAACGSSKNAATCVPGAQQACTCTGGQTGFQTCLSSGHAFSGCACDATDAAVDDSPLADAAKACGDGISVAGEYCLQLTNTTLNASGNVISITSGDFNEDGLPDLAVANVSSIVIFIASAPGQFTQPGTTINLQDAVSVRAADFDGDGHLDLAVGRQLPTNEVTFLWGTGAATFPSQTSIANTAGSTVSQIAVGDLDRDGKLDVVGTAASNTGSILLVHNTGNRTFSGSVSSSMPANSQGGMIALGDFNHDGFPDVVAGTSVTNDAASSYIFLNDGHGALGSAIATTAVACPGSYTVDCFVDGVASGRFNNDDFDDIVLAMAGPVEKGAAIELSSGQGGIFALPAFYDVGGGLAYPTAADVNGDSITDVVVPLLQTDAVAVLINDGTGVFAAMPILTISPLGRQPVEVVVADLNKDGEPDIATANNLTGNVSLILSKP